MFGGVYMMGKCNPQTDAFMWLLCKEMLPENHIVIQLDKTVNFDVIYDLVEDTYSESNGRKSYDPVSLFKILLLEFIYDLSDVQVIERLSTDIAFRYFTRFEIDSEIPDPTTLGNFRNQHLDGQKLKKLFHAIIKECIDHKLITKKRFIADSTNINANVNYPERKELVLQSFKRMIKALEKHRPLLAKKYLTSFMAIIEYEESENKPVRSKFYFELEQEYLEQIYMTCYDLLIDEKSSFYGAYLICYDLTNQYLNHTKDKIISIVDPEARVANKTPKERKRGYKTNIIVDEDSEIIVEEISTPFNVNDHKSLIPLVENVHNIHQLYPDEISADKAYGAYENRMYLMNHEILTNIAFYDSNTNSNKKFYGINDFVIGEDLACATCPNGVVSTKYIQKSVYSKAHDLTRDIRFFTFKKSSCEKCPYRYQCYDSARKSGKRLPVPTNHKAALRDYQHNQTAAFREAINKRTIVERRFATLTRNHGLRRSRYIGLKKTSYQATASCIVANIKRIINIQRDNPSLAFQIFG